MIKKLSLSLISVPHLIVKISPWANSSWCKALTWLGGFIPDRTNKKVLPSPCKLLEVYVTQKNQKKIMAVLSLDGDCNTESLITFLLNIHVDRVSCMR